MAARKPKPKGRPPKLLHVLDHDETGRPITVQDRLLATLRLGAYKADAAAAAGISESALYNWIARGEEHRPDDDLTERQRTNELNKLTENQRVYVEFAEAVEKAQATAVVAALGVIRKAAQDGVWQAAAWYLERTRPEGYARKDRLDLGAQGGDGERVTIADLMRSAGGDG